MTANPCQEVKNLYYTTIETSPFSTIETSPLVKTKNCYYAGILRHRYYKGLTRNYFGKNIVKITEFVQRFE